MPLISTFKRPSNPAGDSNPRYSRNRFLSGVVGGS